MYVSVQLDDSTWYAAGSLFQTGNIGSSDAFEGNTIEDKESVTDARATTQFHSYMIPDHRYSVDVRRVRYMYV